MLIKSLPTSEIKSYHPWDKIEFHNFNKLVFDIPKERDFNTVVRIIYYTAITLFGPIGISIVLDTAVHAFKTFNNTFVALHNLRCTEEVPEQEPPLQEVEEAPKEENTPIVVKPRKQIPYTKYIAGASLVCITALTAAFTYRMCVNTNIFSVYKNISENRSLHPIEVMTNIWTDKNIDKTHLGFEMLVAYGLVKEGIPRTLNYVYNQCKNHFLKSQPTNKHLVDVPEDLQELFGKKIDPRSRHFKEFYDEMNIREKEDFVDLEQLDRDEILLPLSLREKYDNLESIKKSHPRFKEAKKDYLKYSQMQLQKRKEKLDNELAINIPKENRKDFFNKSKLYPGDPLYTLAKKEGFASLPVAGA